MANAREHSGQRWSKAEVSQLRQLAELNLPTREIGQKLGRTANAVRNKASQEGISLKSPAQPVRRRRDRQA